MVEGRGKDRRALRPPAAVAPSRRRGGPRTSARTPPWGYYLILRGPLGIGKTTIAGELARRLPATVVSIDAILDREQLEAWEDGYVALRSFLRANDVAAREAAPVLRAGGAVVFDGNFYYQAQLDDLRARLPAPHVVLTLVAPLAVCVDRDRHRAVPLGEDGARDVYRKVAEVDPGTPVDAEGSPEEVVGTIVRLLAAWRGRVRPPVVAAGKARRVGA